LTVSVLSPLVGDVHTEDNFIDLALDIHVFQLRPEAEGTNLQLVWAVVDLEI